MLNMTKAILFFSIFLFLNSCASFKPIASERNQKWSNYFEEDEQKRLLFLDALQDFKTGKSRPSADHLALAEEKFQFLFDFYLDLGAKQKIVEIVDFREEYKSYYEDLAANAMKKKLIFTTAGYYKSIQRLYPQHQGAAEFFKSYENEIPKRLARNLSAGNEYIKQNKLNSAKRSFNRVLAYEATNSAAKAGLAKIKRIRKMQRIAASKSKKTQKKVSRALSEPQVAQKEEDIVIPQSATERSTLYTKGIKAYEAKDYLKAYELFEAIEDTTYKDTELYFNRSQDKIDALGLSDDN